MRVKIDVGCRGNFCSKHSNGAFTTPGNKDDHEWCEVLLSQHVPQGIYIDVDEVKVSVSPARNILKCPLRCQYTPQRGRIGNRTNVDMSPADTCCLASVSPGSVLDRMPQDVDRLETARRSCQTEQDASYITRWACFYVMIVLWVTRSHL